jgi:hypothetical protein
MMVYVVIWNDRHSDPEPYVFVTERLAIAWARKQAIDNARPGQLDEELTAAAQDAGWLYCATYSEEGDRIWVVAREILNATEVAPR